MDRFSRILSGAGVVLILVDSQSACFALKMAQDISREHISIGCPIEDICDAILMLPATCDCSGQTLSCYYSPFGDGHRTISRTSMLSLITAVSLLGSSIAAPCGVWPCDNSLGQPEAH